MSSLDAVPDEVIQHILYFVSPDDILNCVQLLSRRFHRLANEALLWRYYCRSSFRYWHPEHQFEKKLQGLASDVNWKDLWMTRRRRNSRVGHLLDGILATQLGRLKKFEQICLLGYDAKDFLLEQCHTDESAEDVLARRYYGKRALDSIHRSIAIQIWSHFRYDHLTTRGLDRALGSFDMFVLHDQEGDVDHVCSACSSQTSSTWHELTIMCKICRRFDALAARFLQEHPAFEEMTTREKALALVRWLRANRLTGMDDPEKNFWNLRNCLIGQAILGDDHPSLPIVSSAIFCCVAERLGLNAACCAFPTHVHANVTAPDGMTLDGRRRASDDPSPVERMYLDPFSSGEEVSVEDLQSRLALFGLGGGGDVFLAASQTTAIVHRNAHSIWATWSRVQDTEDDGAAADLERLRSGDPGANMKAMMYAALWCGLLTTSSTGFQWGENLVGFLPYFANSYSEDAWMVEKYLGPLYAIFTAHHPRAREGFESVDTTLRMMRNLDQRKPTFHRRYAQEIHGKVLYRVGQVFRHKRYGYIGIINGWDPEGTSTLPSPHVSTMDETAGDSEASEPERRPRPRKGTFYTCLRTSLDRHVVRQDNIEIITDPSLVPEPLINLAGKFFKRFNRETCTFVSNIEEFYPDD